MSHRIDDIECECVSEEMRPEIEAAVFYVPWVVGVVSLALGLHPVLKSGTDVPVLGG